MMENVLKTWFTKKQSAQAAILRDLLIEIFRRNPKDLIFKGGTAISFFYGSERFSEDIDLSSSCMDNYSVIDDSLESLEKKYSYKITNDWENEIYQNQRFRKYFLVFKYGLSDEISTAIDYSVANCILGMQKLDLSNGYFASKISVMKPEELVAEKVLTLYVRRKGRDLYDLYHLCITMKTGVSRTLIAEKMSEEPKLKGEKYSFDSFKKRVAGIKPYWNDLEGLVNNFDALEFDKVSKAVLDAFRNV